jgi:hypothetical protein
MDVMASQSSLALEPGSLSMVALRKAALGTIPHHGQAADNTCLAPPDSLVSSLPSQSDPSPHFPMGLNLACIVQCSLQFGAPPPLPHAATNSIYPSTVL